jgi:hypothetical protein
VCKAFEADTIITISVMHYPSFQGQKHAPTYDVDG